MKFIQLDINTQLNPMDVVKCVQGTDQPPPIVEIQPYGLTKETPVASSFFVRLTMRDGHKHTLRDEVARAALVAIASLDTSAPNETP